MAQAEHEERPAGRLLLGLGIGLGAHEAADHRDVGIDRIVGELGLVPRQVRVVPGHPRAGRLWRHELESERAHPPLTGIADGGDVGTGDPQRRMRLLVRLGDDVARREVEVRAVPFPGLARERRHQRFDRLLPHVALLAHAGAEGMKLDRPLTLSEPQLDPAAREEIERGDALGHPDRVIRGELDDAVAEPDAARPLAGRAQEDLGCRRVRVLLEEVVLDHPGVVIAQAIGQLDLSQGVLKDLVLAAGRPRPRQLVLVEDAESHRRASTRLTASSAVATLPCMIRKPSIVRAGLA